MTLRTALVTMAAMLFWVAACEKDPHDPKTWIGKLDEPTEVDEAVRNLERLKDPVAVQPLGELWRRMNRPSKVLRAIISIAGHEDPAKGRKPEWKDALPFLLEAVEKFDPGDERSIDDATVACEALGKAGDPSAVPVLISAVQKPMPKLSPANRVRIAAVRALGHFKEPRAVSQLIKVLQADPEQQRVQLHAAAALALAETGDPQALPALKMALFIGPIYSQVRTGITRVGKPAVQAMMAMYQEKDAEVQAYAKEKNFAKIAPGQVVFKGALLLGDMRVKEAVPALLEGLKAESKISAFNEKTGEPGPGTHMAILDALHKIGDPSAAGALWAYATDPKTDDAIRPRAIDVYSWLSADTSALDQLQKWFEAADQEDQIRAVAAIAYGRIARTEAQARVLDAQIKKYDAQVKAAEARIQAAKSQADKDRAESEKATAEQWRGVFQEARYRVDAALQCKDDPVCYAGLFAGKDVAIGRPGLPKAERAAVELYRMGSKGAPALDAVLQHADTTERLVRDGILLALPRIAPLPCAKCAERLHQVIESQASQTTLDALNAETRILYHYFLWAGK